MDTLSRKPKNKKSRQRKVTLEYRFDSISDEEMLKLFPLPRYFQIHFNHVHENCEQSKRQINELKQDFERIEQKLDRLLMLLHEEQI